MKYDVIYDSGYMAGEKEYAMERAHFDSPIVSVTVLFQQEKVYLQADSDGNAVFYNEEGAQLYKTQADGKGLCFSRFHCAVKDGVICVRFPIQEEVDHYPNCDGEYDRYSYITKENVIVEYRV